jgi:hypothetical protein
VAVEEGRRLGMTGSDIARHLHNFWMSTNAVARLNQNIADFLAKAGPIPT